MTGDAPDLRFPRPRACAARAVPAMVVPPTRHPTSPLTRRDTTDDAARVSPLLIRRHVTPLTAVKPALPRGEAPGPGENSSVSVTEAVNVAAWRVGGIVKKRIALVSVLALLLMGTSMGALPGQAATRNEDRQTAVYQGYTVSWSTSDPSDVRIERTPGRAERLPRGASSKSVDRAKSRVSALSSTSTAAGDSCTAVPDNFGSAIFTPACAIHDRATARRVRLTGWNATSNFSSTCGWPAIRRTRCGRGCC